MTNHDQFDELLDHALSEYRDAEPLAGMEDRVLQRLQSQPAERRRTWWIWGALAACAALLLIGVWIGVGAPSRRLLAGWSSSQPKTAKQETASQKQVAPPPAVASQPREIAAARKQPNLTPAPPEAGGVGHPAPIARPEAPAQSPAKSSQFPTPAPLTAEEHALLALLHSNPNVLADQVEDAGQTEISPLEIKPLAGSAAPTQENNHE